MTGVIYCYLLTLIAAVWHPSSTTALQEENHNISLAVMAPSPGDLTMGYEGGPALIPAVRIAIRDINNMRDVLPDYNLQLVETESGCSITSTVTVNFVRDIFESQNQIVGIIGPACSSSALRIADLTSRTEVSLIHITSGTSPALENSTLNTTFATVSSALLYVNSFLELMKHNKWNRIATLVHDENRPYFQQTHSQFLKKVNTSKVIYSGNLVIGEQQSFLPLDELRSFRVRVVIVFAGSQAAAQLMCYAYHKKMIYPNYQWVFHDRSTRHFASTQFRIDDNIIKCSSTEMKIATNGIILNRYNLEQKEENLTLLSNKTYTEYYKEYEIELEKYRKEKNLETNDADVYGNTYHDAVWAMAIALHNASMNGVDLKSYTYNRGNDTIVIANYLSKVSFKGASGPITFQNDTRSSITVINLEQVWNGKSVSIGTFDRSCKNSLQFVPNVRKEFITDSYAKKHVKIHIVVGIFAILLNILLITITALLQIANIFWYRYHSIKATSPNLNHLVFSGCYLFAIAILLLTIQDTFTFSPSTHPVLYGVFCNTFTWCLLLGYSLIFGTIFTKIWRVYRLFKHFQNKRPKGCLSDNALINIVILLLFADIIICIMWNVTDPWLIQITETASTSGIPTLTVRSQCTCKHVTRWVVVVSLFKGLLMILVLAFSIMNRNIKRKEFEITKTLNILIYGITVIAGMGLPLYFLLTDKSIYVGFVVFFILLDTTVVLCCLTLFLPPVLPVINVKIKGFDSAERDSSSMRSSSLHGGRNRKISFTLDSVI